MTLNISLPEDQDLRPKITVFGVGGAGGNAVNNMIEADLQGVEFWVANTDAQALDVSKTTNRIQLGNKSTKGLGAGSHPEVGKSAAEESMEDISSILENTNMVFITAGMGGGTGTGAAPVIAKAAKDRGILTVGVVTKPFHFEGGRRMKIGELGLEELNKHVDTLIVIPNQNLFRIANEDTTFKDAFRMADDVLHSGVRGITDLITMPGLVNLDFADIRTVMSEMGKAMMGTGEAEGENRAVLAAEAAISNPLLDNSSMKGARGVLINITGGSDMTLFQVDAAANRIREEVDPNANIIFGSAFNESLDGKLRVSVVATGIDVKTPMVEKEIRIEQREEPKPLFAYKGSTDDKDDEDFGSEEEDSFIPPKISEPANYNTSGEIRPDIRPIDFDDDNDDVVEEEDQLEKIRSKIEARELNAGPKIEDNEENSKESNSDFFDIPAFIRKKIKL